jgi:hypothetical protein
LVIHGKYAAPDERERALASSLARLRAAAQGSEPGTIAGSALAAKAEMLENAFASAGPAAVCR